MRSVFLHLQTGNAETSGHTIVTAMGATMVLYSAVSVLAQRILEVLDLLLIVLLMINMKHNTCTKGYGLLLMYV